jgi:hypothetical protein
MQRRLKLNELGGEPTMATFWQASHFRGACCIGTSKSALLQWLAYSVLSGAINGSHAENQWQQADLGSCRRSAGNVNGSSSCCRHPPRRQAEALHNKGRPQQSLYADCSGKAADR